MMLHAFAQFYPTHPDVQLVIAGRRDIFSRRLEKEIAEINLPPSSVRFVDLPSDEELVALYRQTALFIFPSRLEGFGIPPLEAMSLGAPVAAARASSLPEILKSSCYYFDPNDIEALTALMLMAISSPAKMREKQTQASHLANSYSWENAAARIMSVYESLSVLDR